MNDIENLCIDNYPQLDVADNLILTEYPINQEEEISISINNSLILDKNDILDINDNSIRLDVNIKLDKTAAIVVIYNKKLEE